jgi:hypothetical protein
MHAFWRNEMFGEIPVFHPQPQYVYQTMNEENSFFGNKYVMLEMGSYAKDIIKRGKEEKLSAPFN